MSDLFDPPTASAPQSPVRPQWVRRLRLCILVCTIIVLLLPLTSVLVGFAWWVDLLSHFAWHGFWASVVLCLGALALKFWRVGALGVLAVAGCALWSLAGSAPEPLSAPAPQARRFCVANVLSSNQKHARVQAWLKKEAPVGAFFVENNDRWTQALSVMRVGLPHLKSFPREDNFGVASLTQAKPESVKQIELGRWHALEVILPWEGKTMRVLVVHPLPPVSDYSTKRRNRHIKVLGDYIAASSMPTVVLGDFNMTPWSPYFRAFTKAAGLSRVEPAWGRGATWPSMLPAFFRIPIDHILVSEHIAAGDLEVGPDLGSDHFPVCVSLALNAR